MIEVVIYLTTVIVSLSGSGLSNNQFLGPNYDVLDTFGSQIPYKIKCEGQIQRLVSPVFLHASFLHIFVRFFVIIKYYLVEHGESADLWIHA